MSLKKRLQLMRSPKIFLDGVIPSYLHIFPRNKSFLGYVKKKLRGSNQFQKELVKNLEKFINLFS
jgi:hypothetical protein